MRDARVAIHREFRSGIEFLLDRPPYESSAAEYRSVQLLHHLPEGVRVTTGNVAPLPRYHWPIERSDLMPEDNPLQMVCDFRATLKRFQRP